MYLDKRGTARAGGQVLLAMSGIGYYQERGNRTTEAAHPASSQGRRGEVPAQRTALARGFANGRVYAAPVTDAEYNRLKL